MVTTTNNLVLVYIYESEYYAHRDPMTNATLTEVLVCTSYTSAENCVFKGIREELDLAQNANVRANILDMFTAARKKIQSMNCDQCCTIDFDARKFDGENTKMTSYRMVVNPIEEPTDNNVRNIEEELKEL